jgi:hypothetical protein
MKKSTYENVFRHEILRPEKDYGNSYGVWNRL